MNFEAIQENSAEIEKASAAIKIFLHSRYNQLANKIVNYIPWEFKVSHDDTTGKDMISLKTGNFEIQDLQILKGLKGSRAYKFKVGQTEFYLAGRASAAIEKILREKL
jgi:hypothetical protein